MQTARLYSATNIEDLVTVTHRIHMLYPKAAIVGVGVSLGGYDCTCTCNLSLSLSLPPYPSHLFQSLIHISLSLQYDTDPVLPSAG